jgi:hypothetical protein
MQRIHSNLILLLRHTTQIFYESTAGNVAVHNNQKSITDLSVASVASQLQRKSVTARNAPE